MDLSKITPLLVTGAALFAAWKWGNSEMKIAALGVAGLIIANQVPVVRDGLNARLVA